MLWPKKNSYKEFDNEKKIPAAPHPHNNFSNGPSLIETNLVKPYYLINFSDMTFPQGTYRSQNY